MHTITSNIHSLSWINTSICWQQSRLLWLIEGDANSKYFHSILLNRRRRNALTSIMVGGVVVVESVQPVHQAVFSHLASHFKACKVEDLRFKTLSFVEGGRLIKPFYMEEVKGAVWDCDSFKSQGPDGIRFDFLEEFWLELRDDIMRFTQEFHRNGKLTKGINNTFIALILKVDSPQKLNDFRPISLV